MFGAIFNLLQKPSPPLMYFRRLGIIFDATTAEVAHLYDWYNSASPSGIIIFK